MYKNIVEHFLYEALIAVGRKLLQVEAHLRSCEISVLCFFKKTVNYEWTLPILEKIASQMFHRVRNIHQSVNQSISQWINIFFLLIAYITEQKMKFSIKDFFSKCDQIHRKLRILSHLLKKSLMENFSFGAVYSVLCILYSKYLLASQSLTQHTIACSKSTIKIKRLIYRTF